VELVLFTLAICAVSGLGLGAGLWLRGQGLSRSCGGTVVWEDGRFVRESCGACKARGERTCPDDAPAG
jgi:hypothetical protein